VLRSRLVTVLTFNEGILFRTKVFEPDYRYTANFVDAWSIDEIVVLDITRPTPQSSEIDRSPFFDVVRQFAKRCFVPLAAGGGIRTFDDVTRFLSIGADKVVVNSGAIENPDLISKIASAYGVQCVVLSIDVRKTGAGYEVFSSFGQRPTGMSPQEWAKRGAELGAGEILITSIDRDGSLLGYDIDLCKQISAAVDVPVLISGGAGNWQHFVDGINKGEAAAVCTSNIYHFTETSVKSAKAFMAKAGIPVRT
jgi:cyclase